jgi:hypothetical protein
MGWYGGSRTEVVTPLWFLAAHVEFWRGSACQQNGQATPSNHLEPFTYRQQRINMYIQMPVALQICAARCDFLTETGRCESFRDGYDSTCACNDLHTLRRTAKVTSDMIWVLR